MIWYVKIARAVIFLFYFANKFESLKIIRTDHLIKSLNKYSIKFSYIEYNLFLNYYLTFIFFNQLFEGKKLSFNLLSIISRLPINDDMINEI